jgi:uncharacterized membrane protein
MRNTCATIAIAIVFTVALAPLATATPPAPRYRLDVAGFQQGADYGLVTGMNNSLEAVYIRHSFGTRSYWWNGHEEIELPPGAIFSQSVAFDLNELGTIAGERVIAGSRLMAMRWENGVPHDLGTLGGEESSATAISDTGIIAGWAMVAGGDRHLFTWNGTFTDHGLIPGREVEAINDAGQVVGHDITLLDGWLFDQDHFITLPDLTGGTGSTPYDINASGLIVGASWPHQTDMRPVMWIDGQVQALPLPSGALGGHARAVNDQNEIVGYTALLGPDLQYAPHALLWKDGNAFKLEEIVTNPGDWHLRQAEHINDHGQILALAYSDTFSWKRVILTPVPEPTCAIMICAALALCHPRMRTKKK